MKGIASACGSATVINAIATGRGGAFAVDLRVESVVELKKDSDEVSGKVGETEEDPKLIEECVSKSLEKMGVRDEYGAEVKTTTEVPIAVGLSSSSAAANATVLATHAALEEEPEPMEAIEIGIEAAFEADTTITGAFDDASASYLGGGTLTDNETREILDRFEIDPELEVLIYIPSEKSYTRDADAETLKILRGLIKNVEKEAMDGNIYGAQTLNGLLYSSALGYDPMPAIEALDCGAESAGLTGTGPAIIAICDGESKEKILDKWESRKGKILQTRASEKGAMIADE